ncbi:Hypothetical predicted protein [Olea europaea subsp. europaea]|uniref:Uncharacterized protein n=1 Tax=Olea europaea subsp. europaea TaxID=158383 RepID=A0A8S0SVV8_OLEEU|nr:Hypothetical predicted protein [Olea europaea subsp. europaea]
MGRGGFGGRDGPDREGGFCGRGGGYRGRGRNDWNNRNDSGDDKTYSWKKSSNSNSEGWKSSSSEGSSFQGGSWSSGWNQSKGDADGAGNTQAGGGWNNSTDAKIDYGQSSAGGRDWKTSNASTTGWGPPSGKRDTADWNNQSGWNKESSSGNQNTSGKWKSDATDGGPSKASNNVEGPVSSWGKAAGSSGGIAPGGENSFANQDKSEATDGWKTK